MPRKPLGERPMTAAERQAKRRQAIIETTPQPPAPEITRAEAAELQKLINRREKVLEQPALVASSQEALRAGTEVVAVGLASQAAKQFLGELAPLERLMPPLDFRSVEDTLIGKPVRDRYGSERGVHQRLTVGDTAPPL